MWLSSRAPTYILHMAGNPIPAPEMDRQTDRKPLKLADSKQEVRMCSLWEALKPEGRES